MRTLLKLCAGLSLLLSVTLAVSWVRSQYGDEAWVFEPRPVTPQVDGRAIGYSDVIGWESHRAAGISDGRFVWVEQERPVWTVRPTGAKSGLAGYYPPPVPATMLSRATYVLTGYEGVSGFRLPGGLVEWVSVPSYQPRQWPDLVGRRRYFAASLLLPAGIFLTVPAAVFLQWKRRPWPAFAIVASGVDQHTGITSGTASQTSPPSL